MGAWPQSCVRGPLGSWRSLWELLACESWPPPGKQVFLKAPWMEEAPTGARQPALITDKGGECLLSGSPLIPLCPAFVLSLTSPLSYRWQEAESWTLCESPNSFLKEVHAGREEEALTVR